MLGCGHAATDLLRRCVKATSQLSTASSCTESCTKLAPSQPAHVLFVDRPLLSPWKMRCSPLVLCRELEKVGAENAELQDALAATTEALDSAKGAWEQGAAWERRQLVPLLQQHDATLARCASQLLDVATSWQDSGRCGGGKASEVRQRVARSIECVRQDLRACWQELGTQMCTPALLHSRSPAELCGGLSLESEA